MRNKTKYEAELIAEPDTIQHPLPPTSHSLLSILHMFLLSPSSSRTLIPFPLSPRVSQSVLGPNSLGVAAA